MTNKKEFLYILTICAITAAISFGFKKAFNNSSNAASLTNLKITNDAGSLNSNSNSDSEIDFSSNLEIPNFELGSSEEAAEAGNGENAGNAPGSTATDVLSDIKTTVEEEKDNKINNGESAVDTQDNQNVDSDNDEEIGASEEKNNAASSEVPQMVLAKPKVISVMALSEYKERNQLGEKTKIDDKIFSEKGTIFDTHKIEKDALNVEAVESKIIVSKNISDPQKTVWIDPVSAGTNNKGSKVTEKVISSFDKKELASLKAVKPLNETKSSSDSDNDGISDDIEKMIGSDPNKADSNSDGFSDGVELNLGYNPAGKGVLSKSDLLLANIAGLEDKDGNTVIVDSDKDGITDRQELILGTSSFNPDTDEDGFSDAEEITNGFNPLINAKEKDDKIKLENPALSEAQVANNLIVENITKNIEKNNDGKKEEKLTFEGKGEPNSFISIYVFSDPVAAIVKTDAAGKWAYALDKVLDYGEHTVYTAVVDASGIIIAKSNPFKFLLEEIQVPAIDLASVTTKNTEAGLIPWNKDPKIIVFLAVGVIMLIAIGGYAIKEMKN